MERRLCLLSFACTAGHVVGVIECLRDSPDGSALCSWRMLLRFGPLSLYRARIWKNAEWRLADKQRTVNSFLISLRNTIRDYFSCRNVCSLWSYNDLQWLSGWESNSYRQGWRAIVTHSLPVLKYGGDIENINVHIYVKVVHYRHVFNLEQIIKTL